MSFLKSTNYFCAAKSINEK